MNKHEQTGSAAAPLPARRSSTADLERWEIDATRSSLRFVLRHLVMSEIKGEVRRWGGTLFLDRRQPLLSSVHVWIDPATIDTGEPQRDEHIRSSEFLDVANIPIAEFDASAVEERDGRAIVHGRLRLHGATRDVDVEVEPFAIPEPGLPSVFRVHGKIDRQSFGLHWNQDLDVGGIVVGDEVAIAAELTVVLRNGEAPGGGREGRS